MAKKVVVIGSGIGGAACSALLAKKGYEVTVLETHSFPGGRCASLKKDGFCYDFGVHMFSRGLSGPIGEVNRQLGGDLKWDTKEIAGHVLGRFEFDFYRDMKPLRRQISMTRSLGVETKNLFGAYRLFRSLMNEKNSERNDYTTLREYVNRYTNDKMVHFLINFFSQVALGLSYFESSAGEFILSYSRMINDANLGYPIGAAGAIPESFLRSLKKFNGNIRFNEPARHIRAENGRVLGVETISDYYPADIVVSNAGLCRTIELTGKDQFPQDYVEKAYTYRYSNSYVTIKYALDRPVIPYPFVFYMPNLSPEDLFAYIDERVPPKDPYLFIPVPSNHDPRLAPEGKQIVIAGCYTPPRSSKELYNATLDVVHKKVCELFPELEESILWRLDTTGADAVALTGHLAGEVIGLAQTPDQVGNLRPKQTTPIKGLWLVGVDAGGRGIGTEIAAESALRLANLF